MKTSKYWGGVVSTRALGSCPTYPQRNIIACNDRRTEDRQRPSGGSDLSCGEYRTCNGGLYLYDISGNIRGYGIRWETAVVYPLLIRQGRDSGFIATINIFFPLPPGRRRTQ
ncbi:hypothetical protein QTP88_024350 [Uroleucon formosanum]